MNKEIYISVDVEADGPIPGDYSMTALGAVVSAIRYPDGTVSQVNGDLEENRFYRELKPVTDDFVLAAIKVGTYVNFGAAQVAADETGEQIRAYLMENGAEPAQAMTEFAEWVNSLKKRFGTYSIVFGGFPLGFDWMWTYWYLVKFSETGSPFGISKHYDIKTAVSEKSGLFLADTAKRKMPKHLLSKRPHTHLAVDDAAEQADLLYNTLAWRGIRRP